MGAMSFVRTADPEQTRASSEGACFLYVLPCAYEDLLKLGFSRQPLRRMQELQTRYFEFFDLERAFLVETETVRDARKLELDLGRAIVAHGAPAPLLVRDEAAGHTEWYRGAYDVLAQRDRAAPPNAATRVHHPLRALAAAPVAAARGSELFGWAHDGVSTACRASRTWLTIRSRRRCARHVLDTLDAQPRSTFPSCRCCRSALADWYCAGRVAWSRAITCGCRS